VKVRFYGKLREIFGEEMEIKDGIKSVEELAQFLVKKNARIKNLKEHLIFSRKNKQISLKEKIGKEDEISVFLPPTGG